MIVIVGLFKGFCGYYDTVLDEIKPNVYKDCTKFAYPCPVVFNSSDSYKCKFCFVWLKCIRWYSAQVREFTLYICILIWYSAQCDKPYFFFVHFFLYVPNFCYNSFKHNKPNKKTPKNCMAEYLEEQSRDGKSKLKLIIWTTWTWLYQFFFQL